ncbi:hypothetical protein [Thermofilum pendens]|uniref:hypothetical protein n=1 Tax=Thermofilum pendens TaxID=2269 RepID=UPI0011E4E68E|nr:hypothetical protein [Thermofilum pendens]
MAVAITLFGAPGTYSLEEIAGKLRNLSLLKSRVNFLGKEFELGVRVEELRVEGGAVVGVLVEVYQEALDLDGESLVVPVKRRVRFAFVEYKGSLYLLVFAGRRLASRVAELLSENIYGSGGEIYGTYLSPEALRRIYGGKEVRQVVFESAEGRGLRTAVLYGEDLASALGEEFARNRSEKYVVYRDDAGVFGVSRNGVVVCFSPLTLEEIIEYLSEEVLPLLEPPPGTGE